MNFRTAAHGRCWQLRAAGAVVVGMLALSLAACSSGGGGATSKSAGPVTLQFWTWSLKGTDPKAEAIIKKYEDANPGVTIKLSEVGGTPDTSSKLLAADRAGGTPDIVQVEYYGLASLVTAGAVRDITTNVAGVKSGIDDNIWALTTIDHHVYGVPQDIGPMTITYRADLFAKYGVKVPTTWAEYAAAAQKIHAADPSVYIAAFDPTAFSFYASQAAQAGAKWWTTTGKAWTVGIDGEASMKVADFWQDLVDRGLVKVEPLLTPQWNAEVNAGKILSWSAAAWAPSVIYGVAPATASKWASAPLPAWKAGDASVPFLGGSTYIVPQKSKHAAEATKFAAWLGATDEGSKLLLSLDLYPAGNGGRKATLTQHPPLLMPQQADFYKIADQVIKNTTVPIMWGPNVNLAQSTFSDAMSAAAQNKTPFRGAFTAAQKAVVADLTKSGYTVSP